jgi:hypothetical protein
MRIFTSQSEIGRHIAQSEGTNDTETLLHENCSESTHFAQIGNARQFGGSLVAFKNLQTAVVLHHGDLERRLSVTVSKNHGRHSDHASEKPNDQHKTRENTALRLMSGHQ